MKGILLVDKPRDWTSNDVVSKLRGVLREKKIGHSGTLDPLATGLLAVFVGRATRAVEYAFSHTKTYEVQMLLGTVTDTQDITGKVLSSVALRPDEGLIRSVICSFVGDISQLPPMYSALKYKGKKLYELARAGKTVERKPRTVNISCIDSISIQGDFISFIVSCSSGTYIRTLCNDIGEKLSCGACMASLRRIGLGGFDIAESHTLPEIISAAEHGEAEELLIPVDTLFTDCEECFVSEKAERLIRVGNPVPFEGLDRRLRVYSQDGEFLMLGKLESGLLYSEKSFFEV